MEKNLTSGSVLKNLVYFSLPYLLSYFLQTLYGMADLFIIGQFEGVAGTTAVSVGSQVMHMLTVMIVGLAMGATVSIGQAVGAKDRKKAADCIGKYSYGLSGALCDSDGGAASFRARYRFSHVNPGGSCGGNGSLSDQSAFSAFLLSLPTISSALFSAAWEIPKVPCTLSPWPAE